MLMMKIMINQMKKRRNRIVITIRINQIMIITIVVRVAVIAVKLVLNVMIKIN